MGSSLRDNVLTTVDWATAKPSVIEVGLVRTVAGGLFWCDGNKLTPMNTPEYASTAELDSLGGAPALGATDFTVLGVKYTSDGETYSIVVGGGGSSGFANPATVNLDMNDFTVLDAKLKGYVEIVSSPVSAAGVLTLDLSVNAFVVALTQNVTSILLTNAPAAADSGSFSVLFIQDATGGRTVDFSAFRKDAGNPIVLSVAANAQDIVGFIKYPTVAEWHALLSSKGSAL